MTKKRLDDGTIDCLVSAGFLTHKEGTLCLPDGGDIHPLNFDRLETLGGRISNIRYMARAMDRYDNIASPADGTIQGDQQFEHLIKNLPTTAMAYFAFRRLQRAGQLVQLRNGLSLLIAYERQLITGDDLLSALWPEGMSTAVAKLALPSPCLTLEG